MTALVGSTQVTVSRPVLVLVISELYSLGLVNGLNVFKQEWRADVS
jgi:hypothetical protein